MEIPTSNPTLYRAFPHLLHSFHTLIFIYGENPASEQLVHLLGQFSNLYKNTQLLDYFNITVPISLLREIQILLQLICSLTMPY